MNYPYVLRELDFSQKDSLSAVDLLLRRYYGGVRSAFGIRYPIHFLRDQVFQPWSEERTITVAASRLGQLDLVGFVVLLPVPAVCRGQKTTISLINLWCAAPEVRGTDLPHALIRRLIEVGTPLGLSERVLFTGRKLHFPCVGQFNNLVRVLSAEPLITLGLLHPSEVTPIRPVLSNGTSVREMTPNDFALALRQHQIANEAYDLAQHFATPEQLSRFVGDRGVRTLVLEQEATGRALGWFSVFETEYYRSSTEAVRVANLWAFGRAEQTPSAQIIQAALAYTCNENYPLMVLNQAPPLSEPERIALGLRSGPTSYLYTYGSVEHYGGLRINLPFF